jgi:excisionase family DNA binding protein
MKQEGEWLTVEDIAGDLKVHPETVRTWIRNGELAAIVVSKRTYRINRNDYLEFIRAHRIQKDHE